MEDKRFREVRNACRRQEHLIYRRDYLSPMISAVERSGTVSVISLPQLSCQFTNDFLLMKSLSVGPAVVFVVIIPSSAGLNPLAEQKQLCLH